MTMTKNDGDLASIPARQDITVLPADEANTPTLGFVMREYNGSPIGKQLDEKGKPIRLTREDDLQVGDVILSPAMFSDGYHQLTIHRDDKGKLYGMNEGVIGYLAFDQDDRHCWTSWGYQRRGITKFTVTREDKP